MTLFLQEERCSYSELDRCAVKVERQLTMRRGLKERGSLGVSPDFSLIERAADQIEVQGIYLVTGPGSQVLIVCMPMALTLPNLPLSLLSLIAIRSPYSSPFPTC